MPSANVVTFEGIYPASQPRSYLPLTFDVPDGIGRIDIEYNCTSDVSGVLKPGENPQDFFADILLFDMRGAGFQGAGYRGSSGNTRTSIFVATDDATPGYTSGPIPAGTWTLVMGFHKIAPEGTHYRASVRLTAQTEQAHTMTPKRMQLRSTSTHPVKPTGWYKGDLHCHTIHSDGTSTPEEVVRDAERLGLDFLSITDHNTFTQEIDLQHVQTDLILIPGCEVTTSAGHWNIWGDAGWIECRITSEDEMNASYQEARRQGYLTSLNHPRPEGPPWRYPNAHGNQCIEVWNGRWFDNNETCLAFWVKKIDAGQRLVAVGGSDCHQINTPGEGPLAQPTTYIRCEGAPSAVGILEGLRAGHAFVTSHSEGPQLYLTSGNVLMGDALSRPASGHLTIAVHVVDGGGAQLEIWTSEGRVAMQTVVGSDETYSFEVDAATTPHVRAQLRDANTGDMLAVTNPIYLYD